MITAEVMKKNYLEDLEQKFTLFKFLSGFLGVTYGEEFIRSLLSGQIWKVGSSPGESPDDLPPEQNKILNLISAAEIHRSAGSYESLRKTCHMILAVMYESFPQDMDRGCRDILLKRLSLFLFGGLGDYLMRRGLTLDALKFYQELAGFNPSKMELSKKLARVYYTLGPNYLSEAERLYREALAENPADLEMAESLGRVLNASPRGADEAKAIYRSALSFCRTDMERLRFYERLHDLSPQDTDILRQMGGLYQSHGMYQAARRCLEKIENIQGESQEALDLAFLCYTLNDFRQARLLLGGFQSGDGELYYSSRYLLGTIRREEEDLEGALECFQEIAPKSASYWKARLSIAQILLTQGNYLEAEALAREIPTQQWIPLGNDFLVFNEALEKVLLSESAAMANDWREYVNLHLPSIHLHKDVQKRSMGPNFWRKYEVFDIIGSGPVGQVLHGRERQRGRRVAIKFLPGELLKDPLVVRRIQGMIKMWRNMAEHNPYVTQVYEACLFQESFFYAMEYMERDLLSVIKSWAPASSEVVAALGIQICDTLSYYYRFNMERPHGALKPENILITDDYTVKISDFDLLWALEGKKIITTKEVKQRAAFLRTFYYFAPERIIEDTFFSRITGSRFKTDQSLETALEGIDQRADLYSLGIILYELATGFLPFEEQLKPFLAYQKAKTSPLPSFYNPSINSNLEKIIVKLISKEPSGRYDHPGEVKGALQQIL